MDNKRVSRTEFDKILKNSTKETRDRLWSAYVSVENWVNRYDDYGAECTMCGKPMRHTKTGRCSSCEQVWNG